MQLLISQTDKGPKATKRFQELEKKIGGSTAMMSEVASIVTERNRATWARGTKLRPATIAYKQAYGQSTEPLVETGRMKSELTTEAGIKRLRPDELIFGSNSLVEKGGVSIPLAKAYLLQHGSKHQGKHKVLKVTPATRVLVDKKIKEHLFG